MKKTKTLLLFFILFSIVIGGFLFRLKGITDNHSFWSDEAFAADLGRDIITGQRTPAAAMKLMDYEPLFVLTTAASMKIFGLNEFAARIPIVILGTLGIVAAYLLAKKLSDTYGGLLAAFLYAFSQLNLAHHTQAKPYAILQAILLFNLYLITLIKKGKSNYFFHILIISFSVIASLLHFLGMLTWIPYFLFLFQTVNIRSLKFNRQQVIIALSIFIVFLGTFIAASGLKKVSEFFQTAGDNNFTYLRELIWRNYAFIFLPALFGIIVSYRKNRLLTNSIIIWILVLTYLWIFRAFRNIRYLMPLFGLIFVYFGVFWSKVGEEMIDKKSWLACLLVAFLLYAGGYKIIRKPANYYTPNADLFADIQIADYKTAYKLIQEKYPDLSDVAVFNDWYDTQRWYLPQKPVDAYFRVKTKKPFRDTADGKMIYGTLNDFLEEKNKYPQGILIVEDWQSILPEEIKQYAKQNLKREIRVEGLPQAQGDNWPIEVYSWTNK